jgi:hypothetical protein
VDAEPAAERGQPVPPIFQPDVAADASSELSVVGHKIAPGIADRYLAHNCIESQMTDEPEDPDRVHNLWTPVDADRDFGAHGRFDARAREASWQLWISTNIAADLIPAAVTCGRARSGPLPSSGRQKMRHGHSSHSCGRATSHGQTRRFSRSEWQ